jgi:hypothetical protein
LKLYHTHYSTVYGLFINLGITTGGMLKLSNQVNKGLWAPKYAQIINGSEFLMRNKRLKILDNPLIAAVDRDLSAGGFGEYLSGHGTD